MKNKAKERQRILLAATALIGLIITGCGLRDTVKEEKDHVASENVVITETGGHRKIYSGSSFSGKGNPCAGRYRPDTGSDCQ